MKLEWKKCIYGHYHPKYEGCIHRDSFTEARLVHRYLAKVQSTKYEYWTQKIESKKTRYQIQWKTIWEDLTAPAREFAKQLGVNPKFAYQIGGIAFDAQSNRQVSSGSGQLNFNHTCTGSNLILFVDANNFSGSDNLNFINYNTIATTAINKEITGLTKQYLNYQTAPSTGTNTVAISFATVPSNIFGFSASYTGAKQSGQPDSNASGTGASSTAYNPTTTVVASGCWIIGAVNSSGNAVVAGSGTILRDNSGAAETIGDSNGTVGTGSQGLNFTSSPANTWSSVIASFAPVAVSASNFHPLTLLGVGS